MSNYTLFSDVASDLSLDLCQQLQVINIPMPFFLDDTEYSHHYDGKDFTIAEFYEKLRNEEKVTTTQINMNVYKEYFIKSLEEGKDILYLCFSSGLSSTLQSARLAAEELQLLFPQRSIYIVDTLCASAGAGLLVYYCATMQAEGDGICAVRDWAEEYKYKVCHWFTVEDLMFLHRGGRLSKTAAIAGSMLQIRPILHVDNEGHLCLVQKARGRAKSLQELAEKAVSTGEKLEEQTIFISHGDDEKAAIQLSEMIKQRTKVKEIKILPIGPIIGAHSGPGTIALFFFGKQR